MFSIDFTHAKWILISGSIPPGIPENFYAKLINKIRRRGKNTFIGLDTDGKFLEYGIREKPDLIKPNIWELERLMAKKILNFEHLLKAGQKLLNSGIPFIIVTMGNKGAAGFSKNGFFYAKGPIINNPGSVGCGDALLAGFVLSFSKTGNFKQSLRFAVASGTAKAARPFTDFPCPGEVKKILKKTSICGLDDLDEETKKSLLPEVPEKKSKPD
ncbi:MAG TPA: PfkB family carbohydrate kinase [bacterium]|nr:PfkB family carbohydrate kinase [bacterium]HOL49261.1 PfkB family carbohydrate kinase [bacterium]HPO51330.1 PfkB family carbohydrate kinase [bacterium]HXK44412.1 PfkB family carbohydrate kinase [bacterium]